MCGISGVYHFKNKRIVSEKEVAIMRDTLVHRGPDDAGLYISPDKKTGFGHRRLAIIDLSPFGHQPMSNENNTVWVVFNGEIYNFRELRDKLISAGHVFKSESDTEVIIHGYETFGTEFVKKMNGMFAFALWDENKKMFFAARDHLGVKPFYYAIQNGVFYFGSEIKAILAHPLFRKDFEEKNVSYYLTFSCLPAPYTLFKNISKLPAAHLLTITENGTISQKEYWNPVSGNQYKNHVCDESFYIAETRKLFEKSIRAQMMSDVPFGCFLSGGIDSSVNAATMSRILGKPVETFSIGVENFQKYNELEHSRQVAKLLNAKTHEITVGRSDLLNFLPIYAKYADDPNGDNVCFLVFYLSKLLREKEVIVAQVGEGADEIFAGYDAYKKSADWHNNFWKHARKLPASFRALPYTISSKLLKKSEFEFQNAYLQRLALGREPFWGLAIAFSDHEKKGLLTPEFAGRATEQESYTIVKNYYDTINKLHPEADFLKRITYLELKIRLPEFLLARVDKMAMANSIETRVPFLDPQLVELALSMPQSLKLKNGETKHILKRAVAGVIPNDIIHRKKQGFGAPVGEWLREEKLGEELIRIIYASRLKERGILNYDYVDELISSHRAGHGHTFRIWTLITLSLWHDYWF